MTTVLIDSYVLLDVLTEDPVWFGWSAEQIERLADNAVLAVNPVIYAEVSVGFDRIEDLEEALPGSALARLPPPWEAAFAAGKCFLEYRRRRGARRCRTSTLAPSGASGSSSGSAPPPSRLEVRFHEGGSLTLYSVESGCE